MTHHLLDYQRLETLASNNKANYANAHPFPHIVLDNVFNPAVLDSVLDEFTDDGDEQWQRFNNGNEIKLALNDELKFGPITRQLIHELNSGPFIRILQELTSIDCIVADPHLIGGGLHCIKPGGKLGVHADFNWNEQIRADRRLNILIYLNKDWKEEYGGHLELWDTSMTQCEKRVLPVFNRMVIFSTTSDSFHGHPDPLTCPESMRRRSLAMYYYTNGRPEEEKNDTHTTLFRARPGETIEDSEAMDAKAFMKLFVPPIFIHMLKRGLGR